MLRITLPWHKKCEGDLRLDKLKVVHGVISSNNNWQQPAETCQPSVCLSYM